MPSFCVVNRKNDSGSNTLDLKPENLSVIEKRFTHSLSLGGFYTPQKCKATYRVCILVVFRDRDAQLPIFLKNIHKFLMKQNIEYQIFIVAQTIIREFNRGALFNVGFIEAMKIKQWDCVVFHDVDLLPIDDRNLYTCSNERPQHYSLAIDRFNFT